MKNLDDVITMLKIQVVEKKYVDVGGGAQKELGFTAKGLQLALNILKEEQGYSVYFFNIKQLGRTKMYTMKVLAAPGTTSKEVWDNRDQIKSIKEIT